MIRTQQDYLMMKGENEPNRQEIGLFPVIPARDVAKCHPHQN